MISRLFLLILTTATLSACASTPPITGTPSIGTTGVIPVGLTVTRDTVADELTLTNGAASITFPNGGSIAGSNFSYYSGPDTYVYFAVTSSGDGQVMVLLDDTQSMRGAMTRRLTETSLPTGGGATFTTEYASFLLPTGPAGGGGSIAGIAVLQADFDTNLIGGAISSRILSGGGATPMADLILETTTIDSNADFSGTATAGGFQFGGSTTSGGTYNGQIVSTNGNEIVGGVYIDHNDGTNNYFEIGGFVGGS